MALDKNGLTEEEYLARYDGSKYPRPSLTADICIFAADEKDIREGSVTPEKTELLLIRRGGHPHLGKWALPGGFANASEPPLSTAYRELEEETGVSKETISLLGKELVLVGVYGDPGRDPRGWVVSAAYAAVVPKNSVTAVAGDDAASVRWVSLAQLPGEDEMAFDHMKIIRDAIKVLRID